MACMSKRPDALAGVLPQQPVWALLRVDLAALRRSQVVGTSDGLAAALRMAIG